MRKNDNKNTKLIFHPDNIKQYKPNDSKKIPTNKIIFPSIIILVLGILLISAIKLYPLVSNKDFQYEYFSEYYNFQNKHKDVSSKDVVIIVNEYIDYLNTLNQDEIDFIINNNLTSSDLIEYINIDNFKLEYYYDFENIRTTNEWTHQGAVNLYYYPNFLSADYNNARSILDLDEHLILVNKVFYLDNTYEPDDLTFLQDVNKIVPEQEYRHYLKQEAYTSLKEMFTEAEKVGIYLFSQSAYRSYVKQSEIYNYYVTENGKSYADTISARPGHSEHQTGLAVDINNTYSSWELDESFGETNEGKWVANNAYKFGYIIRYPKGEEKINITGYQYEPWHIRYVGKDVAKVIFEENLTLEEYILKYVSLPATK